MTDKYTPSQTDGDYVPSQSDGPDGPRNDEKQLRDIANNTASFAGREYHDSSKDSILRSDATDAVDAVEQIKAEEPAGVDPFDADNVGSFILIQQMRNYDALMALLNHFDHDAATRLSQLHESGQVITGFPELTD